MRIIIRMNKNSLRKCIDRKSSSRLSDTNSTSRLPYINSPRKLDSFTISLRKHLNFSQLNPSPTKVNYDIEQGISHSARYTEPKANPEDYLTRRHSLKEKRQRNNGTLLWMSDYANMQEQTRGQIYRQRVSENLQHYGQGMLRRSHRNSLIRPDKETELVQLHYRLKRQREQDMILKEERAAAIRFKQLLQRYESL